MRASELVCGEEYSHTGLSGSRRIKYNGLIGDRYYFVFVSDENHKSDGEECWLYKWHINELISGKYESGIDND